MTIRILVGDVRETLATVPDSSVQCCVTSPPYYALRDYGNAAQIGLESTPEAYIAEMVKVFREVKRCLRDDGTLWLNVGDSYNNPDKWGGASSGKNGDSQTGAEGNRRRRTRADYGFQPKQATNPHAGTVPRPFVEGVKPKDLLGIPWMLAFALRADGWYWRSFCPWVKRSAMPESVMDRPANAIECWFMFSKSSRYFFDMEAVKVKSAGVSGGARFGKIGGAESGVQDREYERPEYTSRAMRNTDLFFESIKTPHGMIADDDGPLALDCTNAGYKGAHFATFPPKMIEPLVRASTSEKGRCSECGAPIVRIVERKPNPSKAHNIGDDLTGGAPNMGGNRQTSAGMHRNGSNVAASSTTVGWQATCECNAATAPCRILDPFGGAGTTGLVAQRLGRDAILCELNPEYAHMAEDRIINDQPLTSEVYVLD